MCFSHPIARLNPTLPNGFHHTPFLVLHIPHPIGLPGSNKHMRRPFFGISIQLLLLVDAPFCGVVDRA